MRPVRRRTAPLCSDSGGGVGIDGVGPDVAVCVCDALAVGSGAVGLGMACHRVVGDGGGPLCGVVHGLGLVHGQQAVDGCREQLGQEAAPAQAELAEQQSGTGLEWRGRGLR